MSKLTRFEEITGLRDGDEFQRNDYGDSTYLYKNGLIQRREPGSESFANAPITHLIIKIFNDPSVITILPRKIGLTPEQREVLQALKVLGYEWIAKDYDGGIYGYPDQPRLGENEWGDDIWGSNCESVVISRAPFADLIAPLLPDWETPLKIDDALGVTE